MSEPGRAAIPTLCDGTKRTRRRPLEYPLLRLRPLAKKAAGRNRVCSHSAEAADERGGRTPRQLKQTNLFFSARILPQSGAMLDPSSSEETGGESDPEVVREGPHKSTSSSTAKRSDTGGAGSRQQPAAPAGARGRGAKDGGATGGGQAEEKEEEERRERERIQEEQQRKIKLQIYVFVLRCIAYPFNAKQPTDMARRQQKVSRRRHLFLWWRERNLLQKLLWLERNLLLDAIRLTNG